MIIRVNYGDNDFATMYEDYFKNFKVSSYYYNNLDAVGDAYEYRNIRVDMEELYKKIMFEPDTITRGDRVRFCRYVRNSIIATLKNKVGASTFNYLKLHLVVSMRKTFKEKWENDEVIYYFINADKYIVQ